MGANAQTSVPTFVAGEVLTAANMNISARTGIPVFADSTARDAAFGGTGEKTLAEGQFAYLESTNALQYYDGSTWQASSASAVLQVKSAAKTDTFSTTSSTFVDVTGLSISITPTSASNKILVLADIKLNGQAGTNTAYARLVRASTAIYLGDAAGSRTPASSASRISTEGVASSGNIFLDSPATTSATTYKVQVAVNAAAAGTIFVNQGSDDSDATTRGRYASSITVMEVTP